MTIVRSLPRLLAALALTAALAAPVAAQEEVRFQGYTNGCFGAGCVVPDIAGPQSDLLPPGLFYYNSLFDVQTVDGFAAFGSVPQSPPGLNFNNLGSFHVTSAGTYTSPFSLAVRFIIPTVTSQFFDATISGRVSTSSTGGVQIIWDDDLRTFDFVAASGNQGTATLRVFNTSINAQVAQLVPVTGTITASVAPEPMTVVLLATGLAGLAGVAARRRRGDTEVEDEA